LHPGTTDAVIGPAGANVDGYDGYDAVKRGAQIPLKPLYDFGKMNVLSLICT
jgi:hypothetical protein